MQKELEQKSISESQNNQPIIEFLQSAGTSDIGRVDMQVISDFVSFEKSVNRSPQYRKCTDKQRYTIGKYAAENANKLRKFKTEFPNLSESTVRTFKKRYYKEVRKCKGKLEELKSITKYARKTGRPYLLGELDEVVQKHIHYLSKKGSVINTTVANATVKALTSKYPYVAGDIDVTSSRWTKS